MFVTVKFGEQEETIFNPQCKCVTLLSTIKQRCCDDDVEVDLSDENGNVKNLRESPNRYADEILADRENLVLLKVDRTDSGDCQFTPLLNDKGFLTETFLAQLATGSGVETPSGRRTKNTNKRNKQKSENKDVSTGKAAKAASNNAPPKSKSRMK
ncbi:hypothetical protein LSH36_818g00011 [Paralvinella palmiformis]|uniref:Uncharacterized protein n=1 Tax=Paralvinella palmiformis TaxID=53620 RepID=A0AAD9J144_9ANNE|nr:hypothetical protein LSH36_818g00011 [Paralvinella palmiformis]